MCLVHKVYADIKHMVHYRFLHGLCNARNKTSCMNASRMILTFSQALHMNALLGLAADSLSVCQL